MQVKFYAKDRGIGKDCPLVARIVSNGTTLVYNSDKFHKVPKGMFNPKTQTVSKKLETHTELNRLLRKYKNDIEKIIMGYVFANSKEPNKETLIELLDAEFKGIKKDNAVERSKEFWAYLDSFIHRSQNGTRKNSKGENIADGTTKPYITLRYMLKEFAKEKKILISFNTIDQTFYNDLIEYMQDVRQYKMNTISKRIRSLKAVMREALENEVHQNLKFTYKKFAAKSEQTTQVYLNDAELQQLLALDLTAKPYLLRVRDIFIIAANTGIRFSDLNQILAKNISKTAGTYYLTFKQEKTGAKVTVPINEFTLNIIEQYQYKLPIISSQKTNEYIKEICKLVPELHTIVDNEYTKAGIATTVQQPKYELVSTHTARRSFATNAVRLGHNIADIMAVTGHSTERNFWRYVRMDSNERAKQFSENDKKLRANG